MTEIGETEVRRIAELARLELDERQLRRLAGDLEGILRHFRALGEVEPGGDTGPADRERPVRLRSDVPGPDPMALGPDEIAPDWRGGFFVVPRLSSMSGEDDG